MAEPIQLVRIPALKSVAEFRRHLSALGLELPCDDSILRRDRSPLARPIDGLVINGKRIGNSCAIHPMEGWDGTTAGGITGPVLRRWRNFGRSGAKLIFGGEAMAVRPDGRANPNQLIIGEQTRNDLAALLQAAREAHRERHGSIDDLVIGFQLTHSGRFCKPSDKFKFEPRVAQRHPILDRKFHVTSDAQVWTDAELPELVESYIKAAQVAREAGADFVDIKHCHGYLLHEFLGAHTRPGPYGGSFENRTRLLREIVAGIRASGNPIGMAVRLSAVDIIPFRPDPARSSPGKPGPGIPEDFTNLLPYRYGFGVNPDHPDQYDLAEPLRFLELCNELGIRLVNLTAGSPYYNPHIQRPAAYPPSDGYQPPEDPLAGVVRQIQVVRELKRRAPAGMVFVGTAYTYLQDYLPHVAQAVLAQGWVDSVGIGRMILSYPDFFTDCLEKGQMAPKLICRTFSDCTTAPRNGLPSGCYPLDDYYTSSPEHQGLKTIKRASNAPKGV